MKKVFIVLALFTFLGTVTTRTYAVTKSSTSTTVVSNDDNKKCEKCGKEECDGKCDVKKEGCEKKCAGHSGEKAGCCAKKGADAKCDHGAKKAGCSHHKTEEKKAEEKKAEDPK